MERDHRSNGCVQITTYFPHNSQRSTARRVCSFQKYVQLLDGFLCIPMYLRIAEKPSQYRIYLLSFELAMNPGKMAETNRANTPYRIVWVI
jgi:hypothetical protein